jgi:hypothetical protein
VSILNEAPVPYLGYFFLQFLAPPVSQRHLWSFCQKFQYQTSLMRESGLAQPCFLLANLDTFFPDLLKVFPQFISANQNKASFSMLFILLPKKSKAIFISLNFYIFLHDKISHLYVSMMKFKLVQ